MMFHKEFSSSKKKVMSPTHNLREFKYEDISSTTKNSSRKNKKSLTVLEHEKSKQNTSVDDVSSCYQFSQYQKKQRLRNQSQMNGQNGVEVLSFDKTPTKMEERLSKNSSQKGYQKETFSFYQKNCSSQKNLLMDTSNIESNDQLNFNQVLQNNKFTFQNA